MTNNRQIWKFAKAFTFAAFLSAYYFKSNELLEWIPFDLTIAFFGLAGIACFTSVIRRGLPSEAVFVLGLFLSFAVPCLWTEWTPYSSDKVIRLFSLTLFSALAPFLILRDSKDIQYFFSSLTLIGVAVGGYGLYQLFNSPGSLLRLGADDANNPIALGRAVGFPIVWFALLAFERKYWALALVGLVPLSIVLIATGSKGPLIASVIAISTAILFFHIRDKATVVKLVAALTFCSLALHFSSTYAPDISLQRYSNFFSGKLDVNETSRIDYFNSSTEGIHSLPFGGGWGYFAHQYGVWGGSETEYPHNLIIETFLEAGWLPGLILIVLLALALYRSTKIADTFAQRLILPSLIFFLINSLVSGDINGNKHLFALIGISLSPLLPLIFAHPVNSGKSSESPSVTSTLSQVN